MHVSTAYTNIDRQPVEECVYTPDQDWREVIRWAEQVTDQQSIDWLGPKSVHGIVSSEGSILFWSIVVRGISVW